MKMKEFFKKNKEDIKFIFYSIFFLGVIFLLGMAMGISLTCSILQDFEVPIKDDKTSISYAHKKCSFEMEENTRNIVEDYDVIERVNYVDDNWEFTSLPFTPDDNWNEYGIRFYLTDGLGNDYTGICYISSYGEEVIVEDDIMYWSRFYLLAYVDMASSSYFEFIIVDFNFGSIMYGFEVVEGLEQQMENDNSWVELIRCVPNIDSSYQEGFDEGYDIGYDEGVLSNPTISSNPLLNSQYVVYDDSSQIVETDVLSENDFMINGDTKPHVLWDIMRVNDIQYNRILFDIQNFSIEDGYILKVDNETTSELNFLFKVYNAYGLVIYQREYLLNTSNFEFDFRNINIVDTVGAIEFEFINDSLGNFDDTTIGFTNSILNQYYNNGYNAGYNVGSDNGYDNGYDVGYDVGYDNGYVNGAEDLSIIPNALVNIAQIPVNIVTSLLNFELLGLNFLDFFKGIFTVLLIALVIKLFI